MVVRTPFFRSHQPFRWLVVLALLLLGAACNPGQSPATTATPVVTPTPTSQANQAQSSQPSPIGSVNRTLVIWMPDFAGASASDNAGSVLSNALRRFELSRPGLRFETHIKAETGTASLLNHLRSAQRVAPSILPDLVLINTQQLWQLADTGLVPALDAAELPSPTGYYPFAWRTVTYRERTYGFPFAAEIIHQAYNLETGYEPPSTWTAALAGSDPWRFPAAGGNLFDNASVLLQYAGAGGELLEDGTVSDPGALTAVFGFLTSARNQEIIPAEVVEIATLNQAWLGFVAQPVGMVSVDSKIYLAQSGAASQTQFAPVPTRNGQPMTIANTWALAVITSDPAKRRDALDLVAALLAPDVQGAWTQYAHLLPTSQAAFAQWTNPDDYTAFLDDQLNAAVALPNGPAFEAFAAEVVQAQIGVLTGNLTPSEATQAVVGQ